MQANPTRSGMDPELSTSNHEFSGPEKDASQASVPARIAPRGPEENRAALGHAYVGVAGGGDVVRPVGAECERP